MLKHITWFLNHHDRAYVGLLRIAPKFHLWVYARYEWTTGQEFDDPPDEYLLPWAEYWKKTKELSYGV